MAVRHYCPRRPAPARKRPSQPSKSMPSRSRARVFVITGASNGIGAELAMQLGGIGHRLVLAARNEPALQDVARQCQRDGAQAIAVKTDVTVEADCQRLIDRALEAFGRIDVLVNGAGAWALTPFDAAPDWSAYERLWRVNCLGTVHCTRFAWPHLKANPGKRGGQIVGINALAGRAAVPGQSAYCASRFAQAGFLQALRGEAQAHGIAVTVIYAAPVLAEPAQAGEGGEPEAGTPARADASAMPVEQCAQRIVRAIAARRAEVVVKPRGAWLGWARRVAPGWIGKLGRHEPPKEEPK